MTSNNNPPKDAKEYINELDALKASCKDWVTETVNEDNAGGLRDLIGSINSISKAAEVDRKAIKQPFLDQGKKIDSEFKPVSTLASELVRPLKSLLTEYLERQERLKQEAAEKAKLEAEEKAQQAKALEDNNFVSEAAKEASKEADNHAKRALRDAENNNIKGSSDRAMGLRTYKKANVTDAALLVAHYAGHSDVIELCQKLANADIRAAKGFPVSIPGIEVVEERKVA